MPIVKPGPDRAETARKLIAEYGAENVTTRSEPGFGVVFVVPDAEPEEKPEPKKAPAKKAATAAPKPAAAGAAATD